MFLLIHLFVIHNGMPTDTFLEPQEGKSALAYSALDLCDSSIVTLLIKHGADIYLEGKVSTCCQTCKCMCHASKNLNMSELISTVTVKSQVTITVTVREMMFSNPSCRRHEP